MKKYALTIVAAALMLLALNPPAGASSPAVPSTSEATNTIAELQALAEQGNVESMQKLAHRYVQGDGVSQDLREAEKWFRRATPPGKAPSSAIDPDGKTHCRQFRPDWPRGINYVTDSGTVRAALFLVDGIPRDVLIFSGPKSLHTTVRKTLIEYECKVPAHRNLVSQDFNFNGSFNEHFVLRSVKPAFAARDPIFDAGWHSLSKEQQATVRMQFGGLPADDEPPYPREGLGQLHEYLRQLAQRLNVQGPVYLTTRIGVDGKVASINVLQSPSPDYSKYAAAIVNSSMFKNAICSGQPCAMEMPLEVVIENIPPEERYAEGWEFRKDTAAAEAGYPLAQNDLGNLYRWGRGTKQDYGQAARWYGLSAQQGNMFGQYNLAVLLEDGTGVAKDWSEAVHWYRRSAEQGFAPAQSALGFMLQQGRGVTADPQEAVRWYQRAALQGHPLGRNNLGYAYERGEGIEKDVGKAVALYVEAAVQGESRAQVNLARAYARGQGTELNLTQAAYWYRQAAVSGNAGARASLGIALMYGRGVEPNAQEAVQWYQKAAAQGNSTGQNNLADAYENGRGVAQDLTLALKWYRLAAEQKNSTAIYSLSKMYAQGRGVERDPVIADRMLREAAALGLQTAINELKGTDAAK